MTTEDSESDLAGRLGASLTPRVPRITMQQRGEQSSGLFDLGALYAASVEQVMRRARTVREPPILGIAGVARPAPRSPLQPWPAARQQEAVIEFDLEPEPIVRARGIGWFGVAVAWLATAALGATVATTVPAHTLARGHAPVPAVTAPAPVVVATPPLAPPASLPSANSTVSAAALPIAVASEPASTALPRKATGAPHARPHPAVRNVPADTPPTAPQTPKAAPTPEPAAPKAVATSAPPSTPSVAGGDSLEALMRRAVEADAKRH